MYTFLLSLHSLVRWFVLATLVFSLYRAYSGWLQDRSFTAFDNKVRVITTTVAHTQLVLGLWLYFVSPIVDYFLHHFTEAVHLREIRFFGMEHITMMLTAVVLITIGSIKSKRRATDVGKFKTIAIWYSITLFIIFMSIPWSFSPLTSRPLLRPF